MATWNDLKAYIRNNYKSGDEGPDRVKLVFDVGELRSQVVMVWHIQMSGSNAEWVQIESPIGELGSIDLNAALQIVGNTLVGGLALTGNIVTFRHSVPLEDLSINEFDIPLHLVTGTADQLEKALGGGDKF